MIVDRLGIRFCSCAPSDLIQGTLDVLILKSLATEARHGWAIAKQIQTASRDVLQIKQGSLYPALHRLEQGKESFTAEWRHNETGRETKVYSLTKSRPRTARRRGLAMGAALRRHRLTLKNA